ncbi:MAG: pentapeptide repeat-containing protein [Pirellulaceae bacterium]|nr:pentapeptide repeat-containing protein [Pirellulaceae bacterium]
MAFKLWGSCPGAIELFDNDRWQLYVERMATIGFTSIAPRVVDENHGGSIPLVDRIQALMQVERPSIVGLSGDGKSTALRFVAEYFADGIASGCLPLAIADEEFLVGKFTHRSLYLTSNPRGKPQRALALAPWGMDEFIQYLLANHPEQCTSVMQRLGRGVLSFAGGSPSVWRHVLDAMAGDTNLVDPREVVALQLQRMLVEYVPAWSRESLADLLIEPGPSGGLRVAVERGLPRDLARWLSLADVRDDFVIDRIAQRLRERDIDFLEMWRGEREQLDALAERLREDEPTLEWLKDCIVPERRAGMIASLLVRARPYWQLPLTCNLSLSEAQLQFAKWSGSNLVAARMMYTDASDADLSSCNLAQAGLLQAKFERANLTHAVMDGVGARRADFSEANLRHLLARRCCMVHADLHGVDATGADFTGSDMNKADLSEANLTDATLDDCHLGQAVLDGTQLAMTRLRGADLMRADLRTVQLQATDFSRARLWSVNLEDVDLGNSCFADAQVVEALLTGSKALGASFMNADLSYTGLAEIEWEHCDLRDADLRGAAFQMGSTRCGLVGSPYPSHGTRTGFYTDTHEDLYHKQPELIRKASLVGCDLRGAKIDGVDFYLVDLRGAKFDARHARHLRHSGAILE